MQLSNSHIHTDTSGWIRRFARFGLIAKGVVYLLSGILILMATLHISSAASKGGKTGVFNFIYDQPFGKVLLPVIAAGLLCYAFWRIVQGFRDTENKGRRLKGIAQRTAYVISGLLYGSFAFYAAKLAVTDQKENGDSTQQLAGSLLEQPFGQWLAGGAALVMIAAGLAQCYRAVSGRYRKYVQEGNYGHDHARRALIRTGMAGYIARGIVWLIIGWLFLRAAYTKAPGEAGDTGNALQWLGDHRYGGLILSVIAAGLVCYGIFMFVRARYQPLRT